MKRKIFSKLLMGAFLIASVSMFVSCKDYDDDINKNSQDIAALQKELASLKSDLTGQLSSAQTEVATLKTQLESLKSELANKADKSALDSKADKSDLDSKADKSALDEKADKSAVTALENQLTEAIARVATLETQIQAIDNCATKSDIEALQATLTAITGQIPSKDDIEAIAKAADVTLQTQIDALNAFQKRVEEAGYLTESDLTGLKNDIQAVKDQIAALTITEDIQQMTQKFQELSDNITAQLNDAINNINMLVAKKLSSLVLKPDFYWEGIEGIEVPFLNTPEFIETGAYKFEYKVNGWTEGDDVIKVNVFNTMAWLATDGTKISSESDKTWNANINLEKPAATSSNDATYWSLVDLDGDVYAATLNKKVKYLLISNGAEANYHVNPSSADLSGADYKFYENIAEVYTRADGPSIKAEPKDDQVSFNNGILTVPFTVDYLQVWKYFYTWAFQNNTEANYLTHDKNAHSDDYPWTAFNWWYEGREPQWDEAHYDDVYGYPNAYGSTNTWDKDGNLVQTVAPLPFVSLTVATNDTTVNSDYAVVVPAIINIVALADNNPNVVLDEYSFVNDHTAGSNHQYGMIRDNHLYETVGVNGTFDRWNGPGAIPNPATHEVVYDSLIDLKPFIETHYAYTTYTRYGQSTVDKIMPADLMKKLGLRYEFKKIDYTIGKNVTSESAHIEEIEEGVFAPRSVTADGNTIEGKTATKEVIDREPLVRVDLVYNDGKEDHIVRYGYIKLRIVESEVSDLDVEVELDDIWMNCGGQARITWSQVENLILAKLNDGKGMTKQDFERNYRYLDEYEHWNMPVNDDGALYELAAANHFWGQRFYYKDGKIAAAANTNVEDDAANKFDYKKWTADNNWFGRVWYTPHDNATYAHSWDEATNVLIWDFHTFTEAVEAGDPSAKSATYAGNMKDAPGIPALYGALMNVAGVSYESKGLSTKAISTVVRFVNKNTGNFVNVKLIIPAGKMHFEYGDVSNKDWSHWFEFNTINDGVEDFTKPYWKEFDAHINPWKPSNNGYRYLDVTSYNQLLTDNWLDPTQMVVLRADRSKFSKFYAPNAPRVSFIFTVPVKDVNSKEVSAVNGQWVVEGASGTKWTLKLAAHAGVDNTAIVAVAKNGAPYGPEEVCYLDDQLVKDGVIIAQNNRIHYHGLESNADLYPAATDLVNKMGAYDAQGNALFELTNKNLSGMADATYLDDNVDKTFTAYLQLNVAHDLCYDPLIGKNKFNIRVHRPINVVGKEYEWDDRVLNDNRLAIKDLVEIVDWNRFPVVAYNTKKIAERQTIFGIEQPAFETVYKDANSMKAQNFGIPYEYYGISELAVRYDEIRTDHAKQPSVRQNKYYIESDIKANTDLAKDLNSLTSWRETGLKTLSLINADGSIVSFTQAHAYNHSDLNATGNGTQFGWLYYNNNASGVQLFHIYVPVAVKYNWGNIAYDYLLDPAGAKLDKDYTQTVWAIITVKSTH